MKIIDYDKRERPQMGPTSIALGNFDGIHLGHQKLIHFCQTMAKGQGLRSCVLLFKSHTKKTLDQGRVAKDKQEAQAGSQEKSPGYLMSLEDKLACLEAMGLDCVFLKTFDSAFAATSPQDFVQKMLLKDLAVRHIVVGHDYRFGKKAQGSVEELLDLVQAGESDLTVVADVNYQGKRISSTRIRQAIQEGRLEEASAMLGRSYQIQGRVVHGKGRGHQMGYATANVESDFSYLLPREGVYLTRLHWQGKEYFGMSSVGSNPTFSSDSKIHVESHLFDFQEDLYGEEVGLDFLAFHRPNQRFSDPASLIHQLNLDKEKLKILAQAWKKD